MAEVLKERAEMDPEFTWDLTKFYENEEAWEADLKAIDHLIEKTVSFAGKLTCAETIKEYLDAETALSRKAENVVVYAHLRKSEDTRDNTAQGLYARAYAKIVEAGTATAFATPEILSLPEDTLEEIAKSDLMKDYHFLMESILEKKHHTLSGPEETLLATLGEVFAAPGQAAECLEDADLTFDPALDKDGKEVEVTGANFVLLQNSTDRILRRNVFESFYAGYRGHINTFAATYNGAVKAATGEAKVRHYANSRAMSMAEERVPEIVYDNLIDTVHKYLPVMYRYAALRKKILGVDELHYYDLYTPLVGESTKHYTYEDAQNMVLNAVKPLGEEYHAVVESAFRDRWIDVYPNKGKSGGAYSSGTYDSMPYILTNFTGTLDSVSTIAHEMGHSMHTYFANKHQPPQYANYTLFVAEVASTVNENLLIEQLLAGTDDPTEKMIYLNQYMEGFKGTVYRQTMFAEFERGAHAMAERGEPLTAASLSDLYHGLIAQYFGPDLVIDDEVQYEWARIPHFYRPFYVYKYATSFCAAAAISEMILTKGEEAVKPYIEFLSMGGSRVPLEELAHAGVDLSTARPLEIALGKFERIVEMAEKLAE